MGITLLVFRNSSQSEPKFVLVERMDRQTDPRALPSHSAPEARVMNQSQFV